MEWAAGLMQMASGLMQNRHQDMFNRKAANVQFDRTNMLRNTAHQAEVADLRAAGLNPILSGTGGMGAATPAVASPTVSSSPGVDFAGASAKEASAKLSKDQGDLTAGQTSLIEEQRHLIAKQGNAAQAQAEKTGVETEQLRLLTPGITEQQKAEIRAKLASGTASFASAKQAEATTQTINQQLSAMQAEYEKLRKAGDVHATRAGSFLAWLRAVTEAAGFHSGASVGYKK